MRRGDARARWERAALGWARWEDTIATWMADATESMLAMADIGPGDRVLDLACGAGSQTRRAGPAGVRWQRALAPPPADSHIRGGCHR